MLAEERFLIRPEMFSFIFLSAVLHVLLTLRRNEGRHCWWLVPLMVGWVNCHALFIVGVVCILAALGGAWASRFPWLPRGWREASDVGGRARCRLSIWGPAAVAATVINPYLVAGVRFPLKLMTRIDSDSSVFASIGEFRSPWSGYFETMSISAYQGLFVASIAVVALTALADAFGRRRREGETLTAPGFDLGAAAVFAALAYLSVLARRNMGIFAFGAPPVVALCASGLIARASPAARRAFERVGTWCAPALLAFCVVYVAATVTNAAYRSDGRTHEFGFGVLEANDAAPAVAFARAAGLPGKVYNDMSMGGYLTWDDPTGDGVFMDGRLEVYDNEFYRYYQSAFRERGVWQSQVDRYGANTAIIFHRWGNRQGLIAAIMADPAWTLVYHDPVAVIFVRREGHEKIITRALEKAADWNQATLERLRAPASSWRYSVSRLVELETYARLLPLLGRSDLAIELWQLLLDASPGPGQEKRARLSLGYQLARRGRNEEALLHFRRALEIDPSDTQVQRLIAQIGG
jgi:hypothetical protein